MFDKWEVRWSLRQYFWTSHEQHGCGITPGYFRFDQEYLLPKLKAFSQSYSVNDEDVKSESGKTYSLHPVDAHK